MSERATVLVLRIVTALFLLGTAALAQEGGLYTWTDEAGVLHMSDSPDKIPQEYRSKAQRVGGGPANTGPAEGPSTGSPPPAGQDEASQKAYWQSRMKDAQRRLQYAEDKLQQLTKRKSDLQAQWGSAGSALPPQSVLDEMKQIDGDIAGARAAVDKARDVINNVIPDEARRAGVPPGWLREVQ